MLIAALLSLLAAEPSLEELVRAQAAKIEKLSSAVDVLLRERAAGASPPATDRWPEAAAPRRRLSTVGTTLELKPDDSTTIELTADTAGVVQLSAPADVCLSTGGDDGREEDS